MNWYTKNDNEVQAVKFTEGSRADVLAFLEGLGTILWIRYSLSDEYDILCLDNEGEALHTFKDCYIVWDAKRKELSAVRFDEFEEDYTPVVMMLGPAPLSVDAQGECEVEGDYPAVLREGASYQLNLVTTSPIHKHRNGNGVEGYWVGFRCLAPEGETSFSYRKDVGDDASVLDGQRWTELPLESNVDGNGGSGVAFYFDKEAVGDKRVFIELRFGSTPESRSYRFDVDLSMVEIVQ